MASVSDVYTLRSVQEDEIGMIAREVYDSFNHASFTLSQLNLSRQVVEDWMRFELETEHKRKHCFVLVHNPTSQICSVALHKSHWMMTLPLPKELAPIAPRYYLLQEIHMKYTQQLSLDPADVAYGDFWFIREEHRGQRLFSTINKVGVQKMQDLGYTGIISEVSNPYLLKILKSMGVNILAELNAADYVFNGTKPFMKDTPMTVYYRNYQSKPRL